MPSESYSQSEMSSFLSSISAATSFNLQQTQRVAGAWSACKALLYINGPGLEKTRQGKQASDSHNKQRGLLCTAHNKVSGCMGIAHRQAVSARHGPARISKQPPPPLSIPFVGDGAAGEHQARNLGGGLEEPERRVAQVAARQVQASQVDQCRQVLGAACRQLGASQVWSWGEQGEEQGMRCLVSDRP